MKPTTIALAIPWCPWIPERVESKARLDASLDTPGSSILETVREFTEKAPNDQWSEEVFNWLGAQHVDWCGQIQEDAEVAPGYWKKLAALLRALPDDAEIVGLQVPHRAAPAIARAGERLFTTADMLIGVNWYMRRETLKAFLTWRATELRDGWRKPVPPKNLPSLTEDTMIGVFALATGRRIWHPVPTLVDHDVTIASVWGNDDHANRTATQRWDASPPGASAWKLEDLEGADFWRTPTPRHMGRFYDATPRLALTWVESFTTKDFARVRADTGEPELRRLAHLERGRAAFKPLATALVCSPFKGKPAPEHQRTVVQLVHDETLELLEPIEVIGQKAAQENIVRARSRHARDVLEVGADVAVLLDGDVSAVPGMIRRMVACVVGGRDIVCAPYPRREHIDLGRVALPDPLGRPPASRAYVYDLKLLDDAPKMKDVSELGAYLIAHGEADGCVEVKSMPIGCSVIHRRVFERMTEHYRAELEIDDDVGGAKSPLVLLFHMPLVDRGLQGEDTAFLARARAIGFKVHAYFGPGSPATHHGTHAYAGELAAFGLYRDPTPAPAHARTTDPAPPLEGDEASS